MNQLSARILVITLLASLLTSCGPKATPVPSDLMTASEQPATELPATPSPLMPTLSPTDWSWSRVQIEIPSAIGGMQAVYDTNRHVTVLFGGRDGNQPLSETWEFNSISWNQVNPAHTPPARFWHGMAYDSTRQMVVLFGGDTSTSSTSYLNDTWEYNGRDWKQITTTNSPAPRGHGALLVYDTCRQKTILFGGDTANGTEASTWEYDGSNWNEKQTPVFPPGRSLAAMVFDPERCKTVLFGGDAGPNGLNDTWEYDGSTWTLISTPDSPPARWAHSMAYYPATGSFILFGGYLPGISTTANDSWTYDGETWSQIIADNPPSAREQHFLVNGFSGDNIFLLGGDEMWVLLQRDVAIALTLTPQPTITSTLLPSPTRHCAAGWSRLEWGNYAIVTPGNLPNRVRSAPNLKPDNIISTLTPGTIVQIIEGPWCVDGLVFWKVENDTIPGGSGWTAEGDGINYYLEPFSP